MKGGSNPVLLKKPFQREATRRHWIEPSIFLPKYGELVVLSYLLDEEQRRLQGPHEPLTKDYY